MKLEPIVEKGMLKIVDVTSQELTTLNLMLTKQIDNFQFKKKFMKGNWDGKVKFLIGNRFIPLGLWKEVYDIFKNNNLKVEISNFGLVVDREIKFEEFEKWCNGFFKGNEKQPRDYQIKTAYLILKYKKCLSELATSAGKTLILFMVLAYLYDTKKIEKAFIILPNAPLVGQMIEEFEEYNIQGKINLKYQEIYSGRKILPNCNLVVGTFQSLVKKEADYFSEFQCVAIDEAHKIQSHSIKTILEKSFHAEYRFGLSGTFPKDGTLDSYNILSFTGPIVNRVNAEFLQGRGDVSKCKIIVKKLKYAPSNIKEAFYNLFNTTSENRKKLLKLEQGYMAKNEDRLNYICKDIISHQNNSMVLFHGREYGKKIYNRLRDLTSDREIYFVDGNTPVDRREYFQAEMESGTSKLLVASFGTSSTGINIKNIHNLFLCESFKSDTIIRQTIGRGLRLHDLKDYLNIVDYVDDFSWKNWKNYLHKHMDVRINETYSVQKFQYVIEEIVICDDTF